jgi:hypothetical protein
VHKEINATSASPSRSFNEARDVLYLYLIALWGKPFDLAAMPATKRSLKKY